MKRVFSIIFLSVILCSCVPLKQAQNVNGYYIYEPEKASADNPQKHSEFVFQIYNSPKAFKRYLSKRFSYMASFNPDDFYADVNGANIHFKVIDDRDASVYLDFTDIIFKKEDPKLVSSGKDKHYIFIQATTEKGEDCLSTDSFYRYIVSKYLDDIRMGFKAY